MDEVLKKYKVEVATKDAYKGRGEPLEWRLVKKEKIFQLRKSGEDCWARVYSCPGNTACHEAEACKQEIQKKKKKRS